MSAFVFWVGRGDNNGEDSLYTREVVRDSEGYLIVLLDTKIQKSSWVIQLSFFQEVLKKTI